MEPLGSGLAGSVARLSRKALTAFGAAVREHPTTTDGFHTRTETMAALAHDFAGLIGAFHVTNSGSSKKERTLHLKRRAPLVQGQDGLRSVQPK